MFYCEVDVSNFIFQQGDDASSYFIIEKGSMSIIINNEVMYKKNHSIFLNILLSFFLLIKNLHVYEPDSTYL